MKLKPILLIIVLIGVITSIALIQRTRVTPSNVDIPQHQQLGSTATSIPEMDEETRNRIQEKIDKYPIAPELIGNQGWINSEPLTLRELKGKVVLVDFWTYTCINCIRTQPYLNDWDNKYRDDGLVILGVHTPEFEFEKKYENVVEAVKKHEIKYPVVQDNNYATWQAYKNRFWPRKYLIDIDGFIRYDHIGEGAYDETEDMIRILLMEKDDSLNEKKSDIDSNVEFSKINSPEIYFGYKFARGNFGNPEGIVPNEQVTYKTPSTIEPNKAYLDGTWISDEDGMELLSDFGSIILIYNAKFVNIVAGSDSDSKATILLNNNPLTDKNKGEDIQLLDDKSISTINEFKLYNLISTEDYGLNAIQINAKKGFKIFTFTFG
tara:strand:- start:432 stop:1565 length:1134 start_codon:yes stop_codon:yes gene_type:complete